MYESLDAAVKRDYEQLKAALLKAFSANIFAALQDQIDPFQQGAPSYEQAAKQLGLTSSGVRFHAFKMRRRFREMIEQVIADTVSSAQEIAEELTYLQSVFENPNT